MNFTRETLISMPISQLRGLDIKSKEDESLVQEVLDEKLQNEPVFDPNRVTFTSGQTDGLTPEKEALLQAQIDDEEDEEEDDEAILPPTLEGEYENDKAKYVEPTVPEVVEPVAKKPFCDTCDSKGVRHKKGCPKITK